MGKPIDELYKALRDQAKELERCRQSRTRAQAMVYDALFPPKEGRATELEEAKANAAFYRMEMDRAIKDRDQARAELRKVLTCQQVFPKDGE